MCRSIRFGGSAALLVLLLVFTACGSSTSTSSGSSSAGLTITKPWARTTAPGATTAAAYVTLTSSGGDSLVGVKVDKTVAGSAALHETMSAGSQTTMSGSSMAMAGSTTAGGSDQMSMQPVAAIELAPGKAVSLEPGGYHIMLEELVKPLTKGQTFTLQLAFSKAGTKDVTFTVGDNAP